MPFSMLVPTSYYCARGAPRVREDYQGQKTLGEAR